MNVYRHCAKLAVVCALASPGAAPARAQHATLRTDSALLTVADSMEELGRLTAYVRANPRDGSAWYRRGLLAAGLAERSRQPPRPKGLDPTLLLRDADTSLRLAAQLSPEQPRFLIEVGSFLLRSNSAMARSAARGFYKKGLESARKTREPALIAETALFYGRTMWWQYDVMANRRVMTTTLVPLRSVTRAMTPLDEKAIDVLDWVQRSQLAAEIQAAQSGRGFTGGRQLPPNEVDRLLVGTGADVQNNSAPTTSFKGARELIELNSRPRTDDVAGASPFLTARNAFYEAYQAAPAYPGTFRSVAMVLADRRLWRELTTFAEQHLRRFAEEPVAYMALGLAYQRQQLDAGAMVAFEKWLGLVGVDERARLDNISRVLPPDSAGVLDDDRTRVRRERMYWALANPLWADSLRQTKTEFLARVAYAELRWTLEETGLSGADSDRGETYVRYGPPDQIAVFGGAAGESADITTFWMYDSGLMFAFNGMPTFGTARIAHGDGQMVESLRNALPVRWDNVTRPVIDTIPARVARFRANRDSVDVVIAAQLPAPDSIRASMSISADVRRFFWLTTDELRRLVTSVEHLDTAGVQSWVARVAPTDLVYRVEAFGETASRVGAASGVIPASTSDFPLHGPGISDVLVAERIGASPALGSRWDAFAATPAAGGVKAGQSISLVWENYEFASDSGSLRYGVTVTVERQRSRTGRIAANIVGAIASAVRVELDDDRVVIAYDRVTPARAVLGDYVTMSLGATPPGTYKVTVAVRDKVRGATFARSVLLAIRP